MKKAFTVALLCLSIAVPALPQNKPRRRVAVLSFDYATVQNSVSALWGTNQDVGKGISELLVNRLVKDGSYSVIERSMLDKVLSEQNFSNSDRADNTTAAKIGRVLGVDAIITGSITQFGRDDRNLNGSGLGRLGDKYGLGGIGAKKSKAVVAITARLIDTSTAEILASAEGKGESQRSGTNVLGGGGSGGGEGGGAAGMNSSNFGATILGEAVGQAVTQLAQQLEASAGQLPVHVIKIEGMVADVSGGVVTINVGSRAGVHVGDRLRVSHPGREIKDPASGKVLTRREDVLGELVITNVDEQFAEGTISGTMPKVGDSVRTAQ